MTDRGTGERERLWRRPDASMTLLNEVIERPLDPSYAAATEARRAGTRRQPSLGSKILTFVMALSLGLGGVWAARALRAPTTPATNARAVLIEQIQERGTTADVLAAANDDLRAEITDLQASALGPGADDALEQSADLAVHAGSTAVVGPGIVVTLEDSARAAQGEPGSEAERVQDFDLQVVVNGLWASGAEAVAINGHRLTATTAIRTAGEAVLVDLEPLVSPYRIEAIGDPRGMRTEFARSAAAGLLSALASGYSIRSSVTESDELRLPASVTSPLRNVTESS